MVGGFLGLKINAKLVNLVKVSKNDASQWVITILGKKLLTIFIGDYEYEGEIDEQGNVLGSNYDTKKTSQINWVKLESIYNCQNVKKDEPKSLIKPPADED